MQKVSVIIPTYNAANYICRAIDSVIMQNIDVEIIVIDDASIDNTYYKLRSYIDKGIIKYVVNNKNIGVAEARNKGVLLASGKYVAFLDADDWWGNNKLSKQIIFMEEKGLKISGTARRLVLEDGTITNKVIHVNSKITYKDLLLHNSLSCSSVVVERDLVLKIPMEHSEVHEDYLTWLKILKICREAGGIDEDLLYYRLSSSGKSRNRLKSARMTYGVYRLLGYNRLKSIIFLIWHLTNGVIKYH